MNTYQLSEQNVNNLLVFLNRIKYEGFEEVEAINQIMHQLKNPIVDNEGGEACESEGV